MLVGIAATATKKIENVISEKSKIIRKDIKKNKSIYLLVLPIIAFYFIFCYIPIIGTVISFEDFTMKLGNTYLQNILESQWVGFKHFISFFNNINFKRVFFNTFKISFITILFSFPAPIILALLINEIRSITFKRVVQTITYLPHFISLVVICGLIKSFTSDTGIISMLISQFTGGMPMNLLNDKNCFIPIYVFSEIWQTIGWNSIIYIAALAGVNQELYESASIDGANRIRQTIHVTIPEIMPTITIMLILKLGNVLNVGYEKILLLYNPLTKPVADVISTFIYEKGLIDRSYSFSTAVGLFNSVVNFTFLFIANQISKKTSEISLW